VGLSLAFIRVIREIGGSSRSGFGIAALLRPLH